MSENKESNNTGCIVGIVLLIIANLVFYFTSTSSESMAENGRFLLTIVGFAIAYFICKALFSNKSDDNDDSRTDLRNTSTTTSTTSSTFTPTRTPTPTSSPSLQANKEDNTNKFPWGCLFIGLVCIVITVVIVGTLTSSFSFNYAIGIIFSILLAIGIGVVLYYCFKE